jgi:glutamyl-tRNA reductase
MFFYLIGVDHKSSPLSAREHIYRESKAIAGFCESAGPRQSALLATCNRIELYGIADDRDEAFTRAEKLFNTFPDLRRYAHVVHGKRDVFRHALRLAAGLESQFQGEKEILSQLENWAFKADLPFTISRLWHEALALSKDIRIRSRLDQDMDNISTIVFNDISSRIKPKGGLRLIVVGTGKIAELIANCRPVNIGLTFVARKNFEKAKRLAGRSDGEVALLKDLPQIILKADALVCATSSPHFVLKREDLSGAIKKRGRPLYIYDLAVPRDIEPEAGNIEGILLQDLDSLNSVILENNGRRRDRIDMASYLVEEAMRIHYGDVYDKEYQGRNAIK